MEVVVEALAPAPPHAGLRGEVEDDLHALQRRIEVGGGQIELQQREAPRAAQTGEVRLLERARIIVGEAVDPDHLVLQLDQALREVRADEACNTRNQTTHRFRSVFLCLRAARPPGGDGGGSLREEDPPAMVDVPLRAPRGAPGPAP